MKGDAEVKFSDVFSGDLGMKKIFMLGGGSKAPLEILFIIFQNERSSYPIHGVQDNVTGVRYRSGPKGWMSTRIIVEWIPEKPVMSRLLGGFQRILYVYNTSVHKKTPDDLADFEESNTTLKYLPKNATDLCQPVDSFIILKIKSVWRIILDDNRMEMIRNGEWVDWKDGSGNLSNPSKRFYLNLCTAVVREVINSRDADGFLYCRKAMIGF